MTLTLLCPKPVLCSPVSSVGIKAKLRNWLSVSFRSGPPVSPLYLSCSHLLRSQVGLTLGTCHDRMQCMYTPSAGVRVIPILQMWEHSMLSPWKARFFPEELSCLLCFQGTQQFPRSPGCQNPLGALVEHPDPGPIPNLQNQNCWGGPQV